MRTVLVRVWVKWKMACPMTHDELLAKIDANGTKYDANSGVTTEVVTRPHRNDKALRAVVELHKPDSEHSDGTFCNECVIDYPCATIQALTKELQ